MKISSLVCVVSLALAAVACGSDKPAQDPSTTNAQVATTAPPPAAPVEPAAPAEPAKPTKLDTLSKPASAWMVNGKSLSTMSADDLAADLKKAGWIKGTDVAVKTDVMGQYETLSTPVEKGKMKGTFKIIRPAATPGAPETAATAPMPSKAGDMMNKDMAASSYDPDGDVFVGLELTEGGKMADAKKAVDSFTKPGKAAAGTASASTGTGTGSDMMAGKKPADKKATDKKPAKP